MGMKGVGSEVEVHGRVVLQGGFRMVDLCGLGVWIHSGDLRYVWTVIII